MGSKSSKPTPTSQAPSADPKMQAPPQAEGEQEVLGNAEVQQRLRRRQALLADDKVFAGILEIREKLEEELTAFAEAEGPGLADKRQGAAQRVTSWRKTVTPGFFFESDWGIPQVGIVADAALWLNLDVDGADEGYVTSSYDLWAGGEVEMAFTGVDDLSETATYDVSEDLRVMSTPLGNWVQDADYRWSQRS